jgi:hypothetical protein
VRRPDTAPRVQVRRARSEDRAGACGVTLLCCQVLGPSAMARFGGERKMPIGSGGRACAHVAQRLPPALPPRAGVWGCRNSGLPCKQALPDRPTRSTHPTRVPFARLRQRSDFLASQTSIALRRSAPTPANPPSPLNGFGGLRLLTCVIYPSKRRSTRQALCPPKPNELETAIRMSASRASFGM